MHRKESHLAKFLRNAANRVENRSIRRTVGLALLLQLALYTLGFGAMCKAAFEISSSLGWFAIAVSAFVFEALTRAEESTNRNGT